MTLRTQEQQHTLPILTKEHERALIARARAGEHVRDEIVLSLQGYLYTLAYRYVRVSQSMQPGKTIEVLDLVQPANLALLEKYDKALTKEKPFAYLVGVARWTMVNCVTGRDDLIKTYDNHESINVLSLDVPFERNGHEEPLTLADLLPIELRLESPQERQRSEDTAAHLEQALEVLPEKQRLTVQRCYGLAGHAPESLLTISRTFAPQAIRPNNAYLHHTRALHALRTHLAPLVLSSAIPSPSVSQSSPHASIREVSA